MDLIGNRIFTAWLLLAVGIGGCGAGGMPPVVANLESSGNSHQLNSGSPSFEEIPKVQIVDSPTCPRLPTPDIAFPVVLVAAGDVQNLMKQLRTVMPGTTVMLEDGTYTLRKKQSLRFKVPGVTLRGATGNRNAVRIEGGSSSIVVAADHVTIADLKITDPHFHSIHVRGERGVSHTKIYNVHLVDAGQQFIKVSAGNDEDRLYGDHGLIACSLIEYSTYSKGNGQTPPSYTNGIDILAGKNWVVRDNVIRRIRSQKGPAGPAILVWKNSQDTKIMRNKIVDSWRGIVLGLMAPGKYSRGGPDGLYDHQNGLVENNIILALRERADAAIENNFARNSYIYHNTIFYQRNLPHVARWSIEYRFSVTEGIIIQNNLTNLPIRMRTPHPHVQALTGGNVTNAQSDWFADVAQENIHLLPKGIPIDQGMALAGHHLDFEGDDRPYAQAPDSGADEFYAMD